MYRWYKKYQHAKRDKALWDERIRLVLESADNKHIRRVPGAGSISDGYQLMHNGQRILCGSYYGKPIARMLKENKGVHEPQEEYIFQEIIAQLPEKPVMLELGAYWGFYSLWLKQVRPAAKVYLAEPVLENLQMGIRNFIANNINGVFIHAASGKANGGEMDGVPVFSVDELMLHYQIPFLDILHADIQGYELQMLEGSMQSLQQNKIRYIFISTHSNQLHRQCISVLQSNGYTVVCEADMDASYSYDGLIVARHAAMEGMNACIISKRVPGSKVVQ